ncbi:oligopeptide transport system substrate-binding protein [Fusobacterium sp. PH5-7]|uniref:peptide ABC transporter substrate-binding protein n=1 Tax=Fusobacterium sp. PH5-7 TaxID=2940528 RepID=UPI0024766F03|nr:peptide ABC transporter substrate-binding protein [Fusobacterium sp. PH5-7]MDH6457943.1 oligopeptide transport system substrate-binding protein [Fusobacterium sp. PH5-7]
MRKFKMVLSTLFVLGLLSGCGGSKEAAPTEAKKEAVKSNIVTIANDVELSSMDTGLATDGTSFEAIASVLEGLYQLDGAGNTIPGMAVKEEISEDGKVRTFTLRDAKWSDGQPVTANDFVFAWRRLANPKTASEYAYMIGVAGVKNAEGVMSGEKPITELGVTAVDDKTLKVELDYPVPFFDQLAAFPPFYPIREDFYDKYKEQYALTPEAILSNGAFKMTEWNQGANYTMVKNDQYYDADKVKIDGLNFQVVKDAQSAMVAFDQGNVDYVKLTGEMVDQYKESPELINTLGGYLWYISPNQKVPGLENANLRRALALSFDKEQIAEHLLKDGSIAANFAVPVKLAVGPDGKDFRETTPSYLNVDKAKAKEYYEKAKQELGKDKFAYELVFEDTEASKKVAEYLKSEIETNLPGMTINLKQQPKKARLQLMQNGVYELGLTRWGPDYADPMTYLDMWITGASYNYGSWSSKEYDKLIFDASKGDLTGKPAERWEALKQAEKVCMDAAAILPVYQTGSAVMIKKDLTGFEFHSVGVPTIYKNIVRK